MLNPGGHQSAKPLALHLEKPQPLHPQHPLKRADRLFDIRIRVRRGDVEPSVSLPVRIPIPTVESLPSASFSFTSRLCLAFRLRLPSSAPIDSFHPIRFRPCWAHAAAGLSPGLRIGARRLERRQQARRPAPRTTFGTKPISRTPHQQRFQSPAAGCISPAVLTA